MIYIVVSLIYILYLRLLKLKLYKYRNTEQNKFYYKNLSIFILNILLLFSLTLFIELNNENNDYFILENFNLYPNYLLFAIIFLILSLIYLFVNVSSLREKVEESLIEKQRSDEFICKINESLKYSILQKYINVKYTNLIVYLFNNIQKLFLFLFIINLFFSLDQFLVFKYIFLVIMYIYFVLFIPILLIILDVIFLFSINIPNCIIYSKGIQDSNIYIYGFFDDIDPSKVLKNMENVDKSIKKVHNLGI